MTITRLGLLTLFFLFSLNAFGVNRSLVDKKNVSEGDSLVLIENKTQEMRIIQLKQKIKVKLNDETEIKGAFSALNKEVLTILSKGKEEKVLMKDVAKIKVYSSEEKKTFGSLIVLLGIVFTCFAVSFLAEGSGLGGYAGILGVWLLGLSYGLVRSGLRMIGRWFNLKKKWKIHTSKNTK